MVIVSWATSQQNRLLKMMWEGDPTVALMTADVNVERTDLKAQIAGPKFRQKTNRATETSIEVKEFLYWPHYYSNSWHSIAATAELPQDAHLFPSYMAIDFRIQNPQMHYSW